MPAASTHPLTTYTPQRESLVVAATDAEDDYFSYEQAARYGYAEEGGKFREKPHKVYYSPGPARLSHSSRVLVHPTNDGSIAGGQICSVGARPLAAGNEQGRVRPGLDTDRQAVPARNNAISVTEYC